MNGMSFTLNTCTTSAVKSASSHDAHWIAFRQWLKWYPLCPPLSPVYTVFELNEDDKSYAEKGVSQGMTQETGGVVRSKVVVLNAKRNRGGVGPT